MIIQLTDWLYQGNSDVVFHKEYERFNIGAIIALNQNVERRFPPSNEGEIDYLWCPFNDEGKTLTHEKLEAIIAFARIFQAKRLYIHCLGGALIGHRLSAHCYYTRSRECP